VEKNKTEKVKIWLQEFPQVGFGYEIRVDDPTATVADYMAALDEFQQLNQENCAGCSGCCWERAPLTLPDLAKISQKFAGDSIDILSKIAEIKMDNGVVDIMLAKKEDGSCVFLDKEKSLCTQYAIRPIVCHTHTCLPHSAKAYSLRSAIINAGEDALVTRWFDDCQKREALPLQYVNEAGIRIADYVPNVVSGKEWDQVLLVDIVPPILWQSLTKKGD